MSNVSNVSNEQESNKFVLCVIPTQYGKTFTAIERIVTEIGQDDEFGRSIHIVFTMNTLLNNKQFAKRLQHIEHEYRKGAVCIFSSKYDGDDYTHVKTRNELQGLCLDGSTCPRVIVMCSNGSRYDDCVDFLDVIEKNVTVIKRVFAYYDELHHYLNDKLRRQIEHIHDLKITRGMMAMSATPENIWESSGFWNEIQLIKLDSFNDENYVGCNDMIFNCVDDFFPHPYIRPSLFDYEELDHQVYGFIKHTLEKYPEILGEKTRTFIPAHIRRVGHDCVKDLVFDLQPQAVVIIINGYRKVLQYKDEHKHTKTLPLISTEEELCETIAKLMIKHQLEDRPLVITGFLCVGMGQTLTHKTLGSFTSAIFSHLDLTNDKIYQLFGRITGRMKDWEDGKFVQTQVYCPSVIMNRCIMMEQCARNMACEYNGSVATKSDYTYPMIAMSDEVRNVRKGLKRKTYKM
jgi:hypothetical protein